MNWTHIKSILQRPPGLMPFTGLFYKNDYSLKFHRRVLFHRLDHVSTIKNHMLIAIRFVAWYFYYAWINLLYSFQSRKSFKTPEDLSDARQIIDLFILTFGFVIPPYHYYRMSLYNYPKRDWWHFIYEHEVPKWQDFLSTVVRENDYRYLVSKNLFYTICHKNNIRAIPTVRNWVKGETLKSELIFDKKKYFLKPDIGSRKMGCFLLNYTSNDGYELISIADGSALKDMSEILFLIQGKINESDYLLQSLLTNSNLLKPIELCDTLITFRVITTKISNSDDFRAVSSIVFIPLPKICGFSRIIRVDIETGRLADKYINQNIRNFSESQNKWMKDTAGFQIPHWKNLIAMCLNAHAQCSSIYSVGWDLCITAEGPVLIEGNQGFSLINHQVDGKFSMLACIKKDQPKLMS